LSKVIFFSIPAHGHINPTIALVKELVNSGETITYYSSIAFKDLIISTGAKYEEYKVPVKIDESAAGKELAYLYYSLLLITNKSMDIFIEKIQKEKPDYIIHDSLCIWGKIAATICKIPAISSISTFAFSSKKQSIGTILRFMYSNKLSAMKYYYLASRQNAELRKKYGINTIHFTEAMMNEEKLNVVYTSRYFQPNLDKLDIDTYCFIGPSIAERENDPDKTDYSKMRHPLIYVSMGTVWMNAIKPNALIEALKDIDCSVVISGISNSAEYKLSGNIIIKDHVNQIEVLKNADVFISHAGMNSVGESLYFEVPLCMHPFQFEQEEVANRVAELSCGIYLKSFNGNEIKKAINVIITNSKYKENCKLVSRSFKASGGTGLAVKRIFEYKKNGE
jgi:MGT family glycosyltransferase